MSPPRHRRPPHEPYCQPSASSATAMTCARGSVIMGSGSEPPRVATLAVAGHSPGGGRRSHCRPHPTRDPQRLPSRPQRQRSTRSPRHVRFYDRLLDE